MKAILPKVKPGFSVLKPRIHKNKRGQSLAEFILTFGIVCTMLILFVKLAFNYTKGYMIHYANYMASRSYMVQDNNSANPATADQNAKTIAINSVLRRIYNQINISEVKVLSPAIVDNKVFVGVKTTVEEDFSLSSVVGGGEKIKLVSESFLGREPSISECAQGTCRAVDEISGEGCGSGASAGFATLWDNGC